MAKVLNDQNSNTVVTITGLKDDATVELNATAKTATISLDDLNKSDVTIKSAKGSGTGSVITYKLVLADDVFTEAYNWTAPKVAETAKEGPVTVTYRYQETANYKSTGAKILYSETPYVTTKNIFTISGVNNSTLKGKESGSTDQSTAIAALFNGITCTQTASIAVVPKEAAFTTAKMTISTSNKATLTDEAKKHTITMPGLTDQSTIHDDATYSYRWEFNGATGVAYKETKNAYYENAATSGNTTINYTPAKTSAIATVNGISKDFKTTTEDTLTADITKAKMTATDTTDYTDAQLAAVAAYKAKLPKTGEPTDAQEKAALTAAKTAYLKHESTLISASEKIAEKFDLPTGTTFASDTNKISAYSGAIKVSAELFDNKNITISKGTSADGKKKAAFTLAPGDDYTKSTKAYAWSFDNATSASYKETLDAYYEADSKTGGLKYTAKKTSVLAKVAGLVSSFKTDIEDTQTVGVTLDTMNLIESKSTATADSYNGATLDAYEAYNKSLYGSAEPTTKQLDNYDKLTDAAKTKKKETALKAAKTAYLKNEDTMETVSGEIDDVLTGLTTGSTKPADTATLTVGKAALGMTNVTLTRGKDLDNTATNYGLDVGEGALDGTNYKTPAHFTDGDNKYTLVVTGSTAKLQKLNTTAKYEVGTQGKNPVIKYIKATTGTKADETLFTITGLKAGIAPDGAGSYDNFLKVDATNHTITLADSVLGTANIVLKDTDNANDWTLKVTPNTEAKIWVPNYTADTSGAAGSSGNSQPQQAGNNSSLDPVNADSSSTPATNATPTLAWSATKGTAKLTQTITAGHTLSHDGKTIYYNAGTVTKTNKNGEKDILLATVSGLNTYIVDTNTANAALDYSFTKTTGTGQSAVTVNAPVISVNKKALGGKAISVNGTGNFELDFITTGSNKIDETSGDNLGRSKETGPALTLPNATAKYSTVLGPGYSIDTTGKKINYLARGTKETVEATISGFADLSKKLIAEAKEAVTATTAKADIDTTNDSDALKAAKTKYKAELTGITKPTTAQENTALKAAQQAYIDSKAAEVITLSSKEFTIHAGALGKTNIAINTKGDYTIALADNEGITISVPENPDTTWDISGTTATYKTHTGDYWTKTNDKQITYNKEVWGKDALIKLTGIKQGATADNFTVTEGDKPVVTLGYGALGTATIQMTPSSDYRKANLALNNDVKYQEKPNAKVTGWIVSGTTATYQEFLPAYYIIDNTSNKITYNAISEKGTALITVTGLKSGLTTDADGNFNDDVVKLVAKTANGSDAGQGDDIGYYDVVVQADALDTKNGGKVTIKGSAASDKETKLALFTTTSTDADELAKVPKEITGSDLEFAYSGNNVVLQAKKDTAAGYVCDGQTITYSDGTDKRPALASISNLATNLDGKDGHKELSSVVTLDDNVITLKKSALNGKSVNLNTTGAYTLDLFEAAAGAEEAVKAENVQIVSDELTIAYKDADNNKGDVLITQGIKEGDYEVDSTGKKVTYYASDKTTTLATLTGIKEGIEDNELKTVIVPSITATEKTIDIAYGALDSSKSTVAKVTTSGYTLTYSGSDVISGQTPTFSYNSTSKKVELAKAASAAGWGLAEDGKSINYYSAEGAKAPALASITGLNVNADTPAATITSNLDVDTESGEITLKSGVLGTAAVSITDTYKKGYTFKFGSGVVTEDTKTKFSGWIVDGTKATYNTDATQAYYTVNTAGTGVTYTKPTAGTEVVTVSGIKSGLVPDANGKIWTDEDNDLETIKYASNKITLDKNALGSTDVTVDNADYKLAIVTTDTTRKVEESDVSYEWTVATNGTTATYNKIVTEGYTLNTTDNKIEHTAASTTAVATLTGFNTNIKSDAEFAAETAVTEDNMEGTVSGIASTAAQKAYNKSLYGAEEVDATTKSTAQAASNFATKQATALTAAKTAYVTTAMAETFNEYLKLGKVTTTTEGEGQEAVTHNKFEADEEGTVLQVADPKLLGQGDLKLTSTAGYTLTLLAADTEDEYTVATSAESGADAWIVSGTTAELYDACSSEYYTLSGDGKTVSYTAAAKTNDSAKLAVLTGLKSGLKSGTWANFGVTQSSNAVTLTQAVLPTTDKGTVSISDGSAEGTTEYTLAVSKVTESDVSKTNTGDGPADPVWTLKGTTATYSQDQTKGYAVNEDETQVTYIAKDRTETLASIKNLNPELDDLIKDGLKNISEGEDGYEAAYATALAGKFTLDETTKKFTVASYAIYSKGDSKRTTTIDSNYGYTITAEVEAAADDSVGTYGYSWTLSSGNAEYKYSQKEGLVTAANGKSITYNPDGTTTSLAKLTGFNKTFTTDADTFDAGVTVDNDAKSITLSANALANTTVVKFSANSGEYFLATADGVRSSIADAATKGTDWVFTATSNDTTAEYVACTLAYYQKDDADKAQSLTYIPAAKTEGATAQYTITGLKKNAQLTSADFAITSDVFSADEGESKKTIKLSENALDGITAATLTIDENATAVRLGLGNDSNGTQMTKIKATTPAESTWSVTTTTAKLIQTRPKGYELTSDTVITNIKTDQTATLTTVSGVPNYTTEAAAAVTTNTMDGTVSGDLLTAAQAAYTAKLKELVGSDEIDGATTSQKNTAVTAARAAYINKKIGDALTVGTTTVTTTTDDQGNETSTETEVPAIIVNKDALGTAAVSITNGTDVNGDASASYVLALHTDVPGATDASIAAKDGWLVSGTTATYISCVPAHWSVGNDGKITYTAKAAAQDAPAAVVITGLKSGTADTDLTSALSGTVVTLPKAVLGTGTTQITTGFDTYTLEFDSSEYGNGDGDLRKVSATAPTWAEGTTSKLNLVQPAKTYMLSSDAKSITYSANGNTTTLATIGGLVSNPKFDDIAANTTTITINGKTQINKSNNNVTVDGEGYTFEFSNYDGTKDSTTNAVTYAKITGGASSETIKSEAGVGLEIAGGKGDDTITLQALNSGASRSIPNRIVFAAGDGNDTVEKFNGADYIKTSIAATSIHVNRTSDDVVVSFGTEGADGSITLKGYGKDNAIKFVDNSGTEFTITGTEYVAPTGGEGQGRSLLYSDNYMETTPVLSSITEITANDYSVGNIEGAADITKLTKEETPIIASSK